MPPPLLAPRAHPTPTGPRADPRVWSRHPPYGKHQEDDIRRTAAWRWLPPLLAVLLGLWGLRRGGSMWRDESVTWQVAHRPLGGIGELLGQVDAVHGLYYLLMHAVFLVGGDGLWTLRLPSVAATALAAAGVAATARRLAGERAALCAGAAYALLPPVQMYAQEGRSYALVAAAVVWATYLMLGERWTAYTVVLLLGCWLHEFAALALLAHAFRGRRSRGWRRSAAVVAALLLPLAVVTAGQAGQQLGWLGRPSWQDWAAYAVVAGLALLLARGAAERELVEVALPLALLPPGLLMAVSLVHPWYVDRYVLYALAGLALLAGARLSELRLPGPRRWGAWAAVGAVAVACGWWSAWLRTPESRKDDVLAVAAAVRERAAPGDAVLFLPARRREWLLSSPDVYGGLDDLALDRTPAASHTLQGTELPPDRIWARLADAPRVVALLDPPDQPRDRTPAEAVKRQTLASRFELCSLTPARGARIAVFARPGHCPPG
ncbi:glycosyltransferase family 39 protein [Streptomyces sp. NPDC006326]|uniref:glycosyltransferase family 39 protein n=1 Tax=Streptomyces sp. NPDC006326 TaxID=3156752 RepID=UPI0033B2B443